MKKKAFLCLDFGQNGLKAAVASHQGASYGTFTLKVSRVTPNMLEQATACSAQLEERIIEIEQQHNVRVDGFHIVIPPHYTHVLHKRFDINIATGYSPVLVSDVHRDELHQMPYHGNYDWDYRLISCTPTEYYLDDTAAKTIHGRITAKRIGCMMRMVFVTKSFYRDFEQIGTSWGIPLAGMVPQATGALLQIQHVLGQMPPCLTIVDIGKKTSTVTWFSDGIAQNSQEIFSAGNDIDNSIAAAFCLSMPLAEEVKLLYGNLTLTDEIQEKHIHVKTDTGYQKINSLTFVQALRSAYRLLLTTIAAQLPEHPYRSHIFFTGGSVLIEGFDSFLKEIFIPVMNIEPFVVKNIFTSLDGSVRHLTLKDQSHHAVSAPLFRFKELLKEYFAS